MVRKRFAILLALLLFAAGCASPSVSPDATEDATSSGPPPTPEPSPPPSHSPSPPVPLRETPAYTVVLPDGLPERPVVGKDEVGSRYYGETTLALQPRPDYGRLYPFVGAVGGDGWGNFKFYLGLCTEEGQIVVDPVYTNVDIVEKDGKMMYILQRSIDHYRKETTFAALDGSWAVTYQDSDFQRAGYVYSLLNGSLSPEYISVYNGEGWGAIDYTGKLVYPCRERFPVQFSEGLAVVWGEDGERYSYVNIKGQTVIGSFESPEPMKKYEEPWRFYHQNLYFSQGLARFQKDGLWGYTDKTGTVIIAPRHPQGASEFYGDYAIIFWDSSTAIDREGNVLANSSSIMPLDETLFWVYDWDSKGRNTTLMNSDGEVVPMSITPSARLENGWWLEPYGSNSSRLEKDGEVIELPYQISYGLPEDRFTFYTYVDHMNLWGVVDKAGNVLIEGKEGYAQLQPSGRIRTYYGNLQGLWDADLTPLLPLRYQHIAEYGDYFAVQEGIYGGLVNKQGDWIVKRSLLDFMLD
ncbi:MAG: hypothetical protein LBI19_01740 [Oscillospiraceae bacterium]|jgi:hypothetical protein|nr:hypothetical protein [Oscillospiraceae bacterium]